VFATYPPELRDLIARTNPSVITEHGAYLHDFAALRGVSGVEPNLDQDISLHAACSLHALATLAPCQAPDWVRGNVVLIGDAAHTGSLDGSGLNMAWEDAAVLGDCVRAHGLSAQVWLLRLVGCRKSCVVCCR
jgi:2-polyprenyl-6-methoxyphenol hydroxylase-like FAD-dependent oxidoreductase